MHGPACNLELFIEACRDHPQGVRIIKGAKVSASSDFGLHTDNEILNFIGNDGLENPQFINRKEWENNPDKKNIVWVDAYGFDSGTKFGYFAFFHNPKTQYWTIKSLKKNKSRGFRNRPFEELLDALK